MLTERMQKYLDLARSTGAFADNELNVLEGVLDDFLHFPSEGYIIFDEQKDGQVVGFAIFGRVPLTDYGWDIYWLAVAPPFQGNGYGKRLLARIEEYILNQMPRAILRIETSGLNMYAHARNLYQKDGFIEAGRICDFYREGDDNIILFKTLSVGYKKEDVKSAIIPELTFGRYRQSV
jgi:ribosomal protein S18 acetylase RimI-like enzyme